MLFFTSKGPTRTSGLSPGIEPAKPFRVESSAISVRIQRAALAKPSVHLDIRNSGTFVFNQAGGDAD